MSDTNASKPARKPRYGHKPKAFRLTPHDLATLAAVREATGAAGDTETVRWALRAAAKRLRVEVPDTDALPPI